MLAFHGKQELKDAKLAQLQAHYEADEIVKGIYWEGGKGCAVGCTVHGSNHMAYETEMGVPIMLARLEDRIFEGMSADKAKEFPLRFIRAIKPGANLSLVGWKFLYETVSECVAKYGTERTKELCSDAIAILADKANGKVVTREQALIARKKAKNADAAAAAAAAAADAAYAAVAYAAVAYAAAAAAAAYAYAADAAAAAAAAYAADAAAAAAYAYAADAARISSYDNMAERLIKLLEDA